MGRVWGADGAVAGVCGSPVARGTAVAGYTLLAGGRTTVREVTVRVVAVADRHGWVPIGVWGDRPGDAALGLDRPGFLGLLERLEPLGVGAVLIPAVRALSGEEAMRLRMIREIHAAGAVPCVLPRVGAVR